MYSWSDPNPSQFTAAQAQSQFQVPNANIGTIVAALLKQKNDQENREQQQQQDLIKGIGQAAVGYEKGQQSGQADDSANAAMYGMQNPGDPYGGYTDPNRVPDYGGTDAMKAYLLQQKATPDPLDEQLTQAKILGEQARTAQTWSNYGSAGFDNGAKQPAMTPRQNINTLNDAQNAAGDYSDEFDLSRNDKNDPNPIANLPSTAIHAPSDTPAVYSKGAPATTVPQGQYLVVDPTDGSYHYVAQDYFNQARQAADAYQAAKAQYRGALNGQQAAPPPAPPGPATGAPSVSQNDVNQVAQAPGNGPKPGEIRTVGGKNYTWDGQGWLPIQ